MNDPINLAQINPTWTNFKAVSGHVLLLADMCFFLVAIIDAHLEYTLLFDSKCSFDIPIEVWGTIAYSTRLLFTVILLVTKIVMIYRFVARSCTFPKVGAIYAPCMSALLLTVIVYDFDDCNEISDLIPIEIVNEILPGFSIIVLFCVLLLIIIHLIQHQRRQRKRSKVFIVATVVLSIIVLAGNFMGLAAIVEVFSAGKIPIFMMFDLYSFVIMFAFILGGCVRRLRNENNNSASQQKMFRKRRLHKRKKESPSKRLRATEDPEPIQSIEDLKLEQPYEDEWETDEDAVVHGGSTDEEPEIWESMQNLRLQETDDGNVQLINDPNYVPMEEDQNEPPKMIWQGDPRQLKKGEYLEYENEAYEMFYRSSVEWPCLSLSFIQGPEVCQNYPYTIYFATGCQAGDGKHKAYLMKWSELYKTQYDDHESSEDGISSGDEEGDEAVLDYIDFPHVGVVNRIRVNEPSGLVATWNELGQVTLLGIAQPMQRLFGYEAPQHVDVIQRLQFDQEGYGLAWGYENQLYIGGRGLYIASHKSSHWEIDRELPGHQAQIEDIQRSPNEPSVFATCSVDRSIRIWDTRVFSNDAQLVIADAHRADVNVIDWHPTATNQIASGSDDALFKVWDLRAPDEEAAAITWHSDSITSIAWNPHDMTEIAVSSADDRLTVWDLSVETEGETLEGIPPQLLFVHQGMEDIKEIVYHPVYGFILATGNTGFNLLKPNINIDEQPIQC